MGAPKITTPEFRGTMPVSGKVYRYRPYLVGEEKSLLAAKGSKDTNTMLDEMRRVVRECTFRELDPTKESVVDVIYAFLLIRARAVGEVAKIAFPCGCGREEETTVEAEIDLTNLEVDVPERDSVIELGTNEDGDVVEMVLSPMTFDGYTASITAAKKGGSSDVEALRLCTVDVRVKDGDSFDPESWTESEWTTFHDGLPGDVFRRITKFFSLAPKISLEVSGRCETCRKTVTKRIEDPRNFT